MKVINPLTRLDYPDPDVIRVEDTYYMVSTTMHFMPGGEILRSYDLANWEHAAYVYDTLDGTDAQRLQGKEQIYGKGMWAASLRFHKGKFYICFVANDTHKTYLYTAEKIEGPWKKQNVEGFYHDCSLLFDDDDRVYIVYGNKNIYITELKADLSGPLEGGLHRLAVSDADNPSLGYEGSHFYKINGKYYLFFIHSQKDRWMRSESCFVADSVDGEFEGRDVLVDDMGYHGQGVAQGGIVDTPDGKWYAVLFQDSGAVGRIPVLVPVSWEGKWPVFGKDGRAPKEVTVTSTRPEHVYEPLVQSDDFDRKDAQGAENAAEQKRRYGSFGFKSCWQFNHEPDLSLIERKGREVWVATGKVCGELTEAKNILTQRMPLSECAAEVTVDASALKEGDFAGICVFQGLYGYAAVTKRGGKLFYVMAERRLVKQGEQMNVWAPKAEVSEEECVELPAGQNKVRLKAAANLRDMKDEAKFYFQDGSEWRQIGVTHRLRFMLDHFTGCRFGLFIYAAKETGGKAGFSRFELL